LRRVVGMSRNAHQIAVARQRLRESRENGNLEFLCGELDQIQADNPFDLILAFGLFAGTRNPLSALLQVRALVTHSVLGIFAKDCWYGPARRGLTLLLKHRATFCYRPYELELLGNMAGFASTEVQPLGLLGHNYLVAFHKTHRREPR